jgi:hypothetical protein
VSEKKTASQFYFTFLMAAGSSTRSLSGPPSLAPSHYKSVDDYTLDVYYVYRRVLYSILHACTHKHDLHTWRRWRRTNGATSSQTTYCCVCRLLLLIQTILSLTRIVCLSLSLSLCVCLRFLKGAAYRERTPPV